MAVYLTPPDLRDCIFFYQLDPKGVYCKIRVADGRQKEKQIDCNVSGVDVPAKSFFTVLVYLHIYLRIKMSFSESYTQLL